MVAYVIQNLKKYNQKFFVKIYCRFLLMGFRYTGRLFCTRAVVVPMVRVQLILLYPRMQVF